MSKRPLSTLNLHPTAYAALATQGYSSVADLVSENPSDLSRTLQIPSSYTQSLLTQTQRPPPFTQSAAALVSGAQQKYSTLCKPLDTLLGGGLGRGMVLELSGPPGTPKEALAVNVCHSFLRAGKEVLFIDMQNMTSPDKLKLSLQKSEKLSENYERSVRHLSLHTPAEFMIFLHQLPAFLDQYPKTSLLVLNSLWFPFQPSADLPPSARNSLLERTKSALTQTCASRGLTVVVTTQLATKLLNPDGSPASFDTGSRAVLVPQPGTSYLPTTKTSRIMIVPDNRTSGTLRLLSSPSHVGTHDRQALSEEPYKIIAGVMS